MVVVGQGARQIRLPEGQGPWSWRVFGEQPEAWRFFHRLQEGDPPPHQVTEPHLAPDGTVIPAGSWLVLYRPIIGAGPSRHGRRTSPVGAFPA